MYKYRYFHCITMKKTNDIRFSISEKGYNEILGKNDN